jgi:hypothetical protein
MEQVDKKTILKYSLIAFAVALFLLIAIILPAEYGIDPLRTGSALGIVDISSSKVQAGPIYAQESAFLEDTVTLTIGPLRGIEYKYRMQEGAPMLYSWNATGILSYDFHGEPKGSPKDYFESFELSDKEQSHGEFIAPFSGVIGWYWENKNPQPITLTLKTAGNYEIIGDPRNPKS